MTPYWSYLLTAVGLIGLWLAGKKNSGGWAVGIGAQTLWIVYGATTGQWGFIVSAFAYGAVYTKNFRAWRREELIKERLACLDS